MASKPSAPYKPTPSTKASAPVMVPKPLPPMGSGSRSNMIKHPRMKR